MDQQGLKPKNLEPMIGGRNRVDEMRNGKRKLARAMKSAYGPCFTDTGSYKNESLSMS